MTTPKILFTSPIQPIGGCSPNVYSWDKSPSVPSIAMSFLNHPGLSFLEANLPCEILPYPDQDTFTQALKDPPEILGISFYINETELALKMVREARQAGVREIWAGNFGAFSPEISSHFDKVFTGWSEYKVAEELGISLNPDDFIHPELYGAIGTPLLPRMILSGILFTSRGCPWTCNFCQTPDFYGKAKPVSLEVIDQVLWSYKKKGITGINILDENFGTFKKHARQVVDLLHKYGMRWIALTRVDTLLRDYDYWIERGLFGAHLGIESLNQDSLNGASKRIEQNDTIKLLNKMSKNNLFIQGFYMIGFENDTEESIKKDIELLAQQDIDVVQVQVLTPYPQTEQTQMISNTYGISDPNLSKYNSRNLVWNHPNISPQKMKELQVWANQKLTSTRKALRTISKFILYFGKQSPNLDGLKLILNSYSGEGRILYNQLQTPMKSARKWAKTGWIPYEEIEKSFSIEEA